MTAVAHSSDHDSCYTHKEWNDRFHYDRDMQQQRQMQPPDHAQTYRSDVYHAPERLYNTDFGSGDKSCELRLYIFVVVMKLFCACLLCLPCVQ